jgi:ABC-2 type transport system permease protein
MYHDKLGERRFGVINWLGLWTLIERECRRFITVYTQTLIAPLATSVLFIIVFSLALASHRGDINGLPHQHFLAPGIVMMTVVQNAFANTSSSLMIAKVQGNIVDSLTPPLSSHELVIGFACGAIFRGFLIAVLATVLIFPFAGITVYNPIWACFFALVGSFLLGLVGIAAGIWSAKFDHIAAVTNFVIIPLSFLSGTFYAASSLPGLWGVLVWYNPIFYLIDGFRFGVLGVSDAAPWASAAVCVTASAMGYVLCWRMVATGYRIKS